MTSPKVLSKAEIEEIVNDSSRNNHRARWPSTRDKELLLAAMEKQVVMVQFSDGIIFKIRYSEGLNWKASSGTRSTAFVSPIDGGYVPCGWFSIAGLRGEVLGTATN